MIRVPRGHRAGDPDCDCSACAHPELERQLEHVAHDARSDRVMELLATKYPEIPLACYCVVCGAKQGEQCRTAAFGERVLRRMSGFHPSRCLRAQDLERAVEEHRAKRISDTQLLDVADAVRMNR